MQKVKKVFTYFVFFFMGLLLIWLCYAGYYKEYMERLSNRLISQNAFRFELIAEPKDNIEDFIDTESLLLYDFGENSFIKGIYLNEKSKFQAPIVDGRFFYYLETQSNNKIAVIGKDCLQNTFTIDDKRYVKIMGHDYEVIGIMGGEATSSAVYEIIFLPISCFKEASGAGLEVGNGGQYVLDGPKKSVLKSLEKINNNLRFILKLLTLHQTSEFFSCLFVKFVLYTAGFLGEGTLLIFTVLSNFMPNSKFFGVGNGFFL